MPMTGSLRKQVLQNFFVKANDDTILQNRGILNDREIAKKQAFIKKNYKEMYLKWLEYSKNAFYEDN